MNEINKPLILHLSIGTFLAVISYLIYPSVGLMIFVAGVYSMGIRRYFCSPETKNILSKWSMVLILLLFLYHPETIIFAIVMLVIAFIYIRKRGLGKLVNMWD